MMTMKKETIEHTLQTIERMKDDRDKLKLDLITCMAQLSQPARTLLTKEIDSIQKKIDELTDTVGA
jgi:hypothetical protein